MAVGYRVYTDSGVLQVSDDRLFLSLSETGTEDISTFERPPGVQYWQTKDIVISGYSLSDAPMFAFRGGAYAWAEMIDATAGSVTYRMYIRAPQNSGTMVWYLFTNREPPRPDVGMALYDESGRRVFSSSAPPARVLGVLDNSGYSGLSTSGKTTALAPQKCAKSRLQYTTYGSAGSCSHPSGTGYLRQQRWEGYLVTAAGTSSSTISYTTSSNSLCVLSRGLNSISGYISTEFSALVLDVTNY